MPGRMRTPARRYENEAAAAAADDDADPLDVDGSDDGAGDDDGDVEWKVAAVSACRVNRRKRNLTEYLVEWEGFEEKTWEPVEHLEGCAAFERFLQTEKTKEPNVSKVATTPSSPRKRRSESPDGTPAPKRAVTENGANLKLPRKSTPTGGSGTPRSLRHRDSAPLGGGGGGKYDEREEEEQEEVDEPDETPPPPPAKAHKDGAEKAEKKSAGPPRARKSVAPAAAAAAAASPAQPATPARAAAVAEPLNVNLGAPTDKPFLANAARSEAVRRIVGAQRADTQRAANLWWLTDECFFVAELDDGRQQLLKVKDARENHPQEVIEYLIGRASFETK